MTMQQAQAYLETTYSPGRKKGLLELEKTLALLGNPQEKLKIIHVAGTNGKGSFCAMMMSVLKAAGYRAGVFSSPHLERLNERFSINGADICDEDFLQILQEVVAISDSIYGKDDGFTFFEIFVLIAFVYFQRQAVDFLLLEVGIGGRVDATNVIKAPLLSAIMAIGMDHMELLGDNIIDIAYEKGGIIKENVPVVIYDDIQEVQNVFLEIAHKKNSRLHIGFKGAELDSIKLWLLVQYQRKNAEVVMSACVCLNLMEVHIGGDHIKEGLENARHSGRMEIVAQNPTILLEGAHNSQGAQALANYMESELEGDISLIIGVLKDKEYGKIVNMLCKNANRIFFTKPLYDFKASQPEDLAAALEDSNKEIYIIQNCIEALKKAQEVTPASATIICTGSLYLIGDIRRHIKND